MAELMPQFREFAEQQLLNGRYDYIIPVESKGMLILQDVLRHSNKSYLPKIYNRRGLDFISPKELAGKRVAVIDDAVFSGRTLNRLIQEVTNLGVAEANGYAFLLYNKDSLRSGRQTSELRICENVTPDEYRLMANEMSSLSLRARPSYPDHLTFRVSFAYPVSAADLISLSLERGSIAEHRRDQNCITWSVHWPDWTPSLPIFAQDTGHDKMRLRMEPVSRKLYASPVVFPSLEEDIDFGTDEISRAFLHALSRPWHDSETCAHNIYEAFTLATRLKQVAAFSNDLDRRSILVEAIKLVPGNLHLYYGPACEAIEQLCDTAILKLRGEFRGPRNLTLEEEDLLPLRRQVAAATIITKLSDEYLRLNAGKSHEYEYESVGYTIKELSQITGLPEGLVAIVAEELNDYGHLSPIPFDRRRTERTSRLRSYRATETASAWLYPTPEAGLLF